jgi:hypothetical protein
MAGQQPPPSLSDLVLRCEEYVTGKRVFTGKPEEATKQTE